MSIFTGNKNVYYLFMETIIFVNNALRQWIKRKVAVFLRYNYTPKRFFKPKLTRLSEIDTNVPIKVYR